MLRFTCHVCRALLAEVDPRTGDHLLAATCACGHTTVERRANLG